MLGLPPTNSWLRFAGRYFPLTLVLIVLLAALGLSALVTPSAVANENYQGDARVRQLPLETAAVPTTILDLKLTSTNPTQGENLGRAVALSADGNTMVSGAFNADGAGGSAYIFERSGNTWNQVKKLSGGTAENDWFGVATAINDDTVVIGASRYNDGSNSNVGAIYIFARNQGGSNNWGLIQKRLAADADAGDSFGFSVAIEGDLIVVGARFDDAQASGAGAIYLFGRNQGGTNNWGQISKKIVADGSASDYFGESVALQGDLIAVRAHKAGASGTLGAVYLFARNQGGVDNWGQIKKFDVGVADANTQDQYDYPLALDGDTLVVGAYLADLRGVDSGVAYVFTRNQGGTDNWGLAQTLFAEDTDAGDNLGKAVAIEGDYILVGAQSESTLADGAGAGYLFARNQGGQNQWGMVTKLVAPTADANGGDNLGRAVALRNKLVTIGASTDDNNSKTDAGAVYVYQISTGIPTVQWSAAIYSGNENSGSATIQVTLNAAATTAVTVNYATNNGTASAPSDYTVTSGTLTFNPGETSKTITIPLIDDALDEENETINLILSSPANASLGTLSSAILTIVDNDPTPTVQLSAAGATVNENGGTALIQITLSAASGKAVTVNYATSNGTASAPSDYTITSGTVAFNPGETSRSLNVPIVNDNVTETDETLNLTLNNPSNAILGTPASTTLTILDDDVPTVQLSAASYNAAENGGAALIQVTLSAAAGKTVTVDYATSNGTASAPSDYTATSGTLTFNPGETSKSLSVPIVNDNVAESDETLNLTLSSPNNATLGTPANAIVTIFDGAHTTIQFSATSYTVNEKSDTASIMVTLSSAVANIVTIHYSTTDGTASAGSDYTATSGTLTFNANETSKSFIIPLLNDSTVEADETINLILSNPTNILLGTPFGAILTIHDDDQPTVQFSMESPSVGESDGAVTLQVALGAPSLKTVSVNYATSNDTAVANEDYIATNGLMTFAPGEISKEFSVSLINDQLDEADENVNLTLSNGVNAAVGTLCCIKLKIVDDDDPQLTPMPTATPTQPATVTPTVTPTVAPAAVYLAIISNDPIPTSPPTWQRLGGNGLHVASLAVQGNQLFAGVRDANGGLYTRDLTGCSAKPTLNRVDAVKATTVLGVEFFGAQAYGALAAYDQGIFYTSDGGTTWTPSASKLLKLPRSVALANQHVFYAGAEDDGIYRSEDSGVSWEHQNTMPNQINRVKLDAIDATSLWIATEGTGVWKLTVGINRLVAYNEGLTTAGKQVWDFAFNEEQIYLATFDGVFAGDGIKAWQPFGTALNGRKLYSIAIVGNQFYAGTREAGVWQRPRNGGDWTQVTSPGWSNTATVSDLLSVATGPCPGLLAATNDGVWIYH